MNRPRTANVWKGIPGPRGPTTPVRRCVDCRDHRTWGGNCPTPEGQAACAAYRPPVTGGGDLDAETGDLVPTAVEGRA